jgi:hypothetical protein
MSNVLLQLVKFRKNLEGNFLIFLFAIFYFIVIYTSLSFASRSPEEFNFGGEWDFILTAKMYLRQSLAENKLATFWATYDPQSHFLSIDRYTHYMITAWAPYIIYAKIFGATFTAQFMTVNLVYFSLFLVFMFRFFKANVNSSLDYVLMATLVYILTAGGYWKSILASFGVYTIPVFLSSAIAYYALMGKRHHVLLITVLLMLVMYEAYIAFFILCVLIAYQTRQIKWILFGSILPISVFALRILINLWVYGDIASAFGNLFEALGVRSADCSFTSSLSAENLKNYGNKQTCDFGVFINLHFEQLKNFMTKLPRDMLISYKLGSIFFLYALLKSIIIFLNVSDKRKIKLQYVYIFSWLIGCCTFFVLMPAMASQGWEYFILMPIMIIGMYELFVDMKSINLYIKYQNFSKKVAYLFSIILIVLAGFSIRFPAKISDKEIALFNMAAFACRNSDEIIKTNLNFNYFTYICKTRPRNLIIEEASQEIKYVETSHTRISFYNDQLHFIEF